jgi:REP element-mobilizing transposase RayT
MPNHFHFLIKTHDESLLAALMEKKRNNNKQNLEGLPPRGHKNSNDILASLESNKPISLTNLRGLTYYSNEKISKYLSQQFSNLFNGYTKAINKRYRRYGSLFAPRFKRKEINSENYFYNTLVYIHFNPIHHRFVYDLDDWPYSSWHDYLSEQSWIDSSWIESNFESRTEFLNLHKPLNKSTLSRITKELES